MPAHTEKNAACSSGPQGNQTVGQKDNSAIQIQVEKYGVFFRKHKAALLIQIGKKTTKPNISIEGVMKIMK